jgi:hypothetical protein
MAASFIFSRNRNAHEITMPRVPEWFDMRDLGQTLAHVHDAEIEIGEALETPAAKWTVAVVRSLLIRLDHARSERAYSP